MRSASGHGPELTIVRDPLRLLLVLLTIITVSRVHGYIGLAALRPAFVLAALTGVYAFLHPQVLNSGVLLRTWPSKVMIALGVMACISVPFGMSLGGSAAFILQVYSKVLIYAFLLVLAIRHAQDLYTFVWAYVISMGILVFLAVVLVGITKVQGLQTYDPNDIGLVLLVGVPLAIAVMQSTRKRWLKLFCAAVVAGVGVTLALSLSRGSFLGLLAVAAGLLLLVRGVSVLKRVAIVATAAAALFVAAPEDYWESMETILRPTEDYNWETNYGRKAVWTRGIGYMLRNPLTGHGIGNFPRAEGTISEPAVNWVPGPGRIKWSVAHNSFVEAGADMGIPGLLLFSSLVFGGMIGMFKLRRRLPKRWARGDPEERFLYHLALYMPISLLAFAVAGSFISFAYQDPIYILAALMAGLYVAVEAKMRQNSLRESAAGRPALTQQGPRWRIRDASRIRQAPSVSRPEVVARSRSSPGGWGIVPPK